MPLNRWLLPRVAGLVLVAVACQREAAPKLSGSQWIDATATLDSATTPVYPGNAPLHLTFLQDMRRGDAVTLSAFSLGAHSGTHVDAPMHFVADGAPIDHVGLDALVGPARVIQIPDSVQAIDAAQATLRRLVSRVKALRPLPVAENAASYFSDVPSLNAISNHEYPDFQLNVPDQYRVDLWKQDFKQAEQTGDLPNLTIMWWPDDHTGGTPTAAAAAAGRPVRRSRIECFIRA